MVPQPSAACFWPSRLRATRVAAAAPNSRIIGGAGTWVPPVELDEPPLDDEELELELDELELLLDELEPLVLPEPPKLLDPPVAPELVEVDELWWPPEELELDPPWLDEPWLEEPWLEDPWPPEEPFWF
jgi:hypothetical protein